MYDSYSNEGFKPFYFCLKNGFESTPKKRGENCPLDEYGLSMIAISVNEDGSLNTCTCRWNHENGGNDNILNTKQISHLLGVNFYETFKPYSQEYITEKKQEKFKFFENALQILNQGHQVQDVFQYYDQITPYLYFVSKDFASESGALAVQKENSQYRYVRDENKQIIFFNNTYLINDNIMACQTEDGKSRLVKIPEFKIMAVLPDATNAYGINIPRNSDFYNKLFYVAYQSGKIQFVNIATNQKSELMDYPMNIQFIENRNRIKLYFLNHSMQYLDADTLEFMDNSDSTTILEQFLANGHFISMVKIDDEYNLMNMDNNQMIFGQNLESLTLMYKLNLIIAELYPNLFIFYRLDSFDGTRFRPFFMKEISEYKVDENNPSIFYIKLDIGVEFKYDFVNNKMMSMEKN